MVKLGVNIDHVATLRQQRGTIYPDPVEAALICERAGCDSIVAHLREDRRHIIDEDVFKLNKVVTTRFNLEMSIAPEIVEIACRVKPKQATLVPERRMERTTEKGLHVVKERARLERAVRKLKAAGIEVSLFIDPVIQNVKASRDIGCQIVEFHTGDYADARTKKESALEFKRLSASVRAAVKAGLVVNAGHGLNYDNVLPIAGMEGMHELNIGHSIISYAVLHGLEAAVSKMKELILQ